MEAGEKSAMYDGPPGTSVQTYRHATTATTMQLYEIENLQLSTERKRTASYIARMKPVKRKFRMQFRFVLPSEKVHGMPWDHSQPKSVVK